MSLLVGICGGSGSGKTTLAHLVADHLGPEASTIVPFDAYYREQGHLAPAERTTVNYDHPDSLDDQLFLSHLEALHRGEEIAVPVYDFTTHTRAAGVRIVEPKPVVILEGILLLAFEPIRSVLDLTVFRDCPEDVRFVRRLERDMSERGRSEQSVRDQFAASVKPMHDEFVQPSIEVADIVTLFSERLDDAARRVLDAVDQLVAPPSGDQVTRRMFTG